MPDERESLFAQRSCEKCATFCPFFTRLGLVSQAGSINKPQQVLLSNCVAPSFHFFVLCCGEHQLFDLCVRELGIPHDTTFTSAVSYRDSANTEKRLLFMDPWSFSSLFKATFTNLYCTISRQHQRHAMEANSQNLTAFINHLGQG